MVPEASLMASSTVLSPICSARNSSRVTPTGEFASAWLTSALASAWNDSLRATKSVSELSSIIAAPLPSADVSISTRPSAASRPARFSALAMPFLRRISPARSMSPLASSRAFLQSIIPAPVRRRSSAMSLVVIVALILLCIPSSEGSVCANRRRGARAPQAAAHFDRQLPGSAAGVARFAAGNRLGLEPGSDDLGAGLALAARTAALAIVVAGTVTLACRIGLGIVVERNLAHRHLRAGFADRVAQRGGDQRDRADRVVVARNRHRDRIGVGVGVDDGHDRDPEAIGLLDRDLLLLGVDHEQRARQAGHVLDALEVARQLLALAGE